MRQASTGVFDKLRTLRCEEIRITPYEKEYYSTPFEGIEDDILVIA